jgi:hypothetical protein
MQGREYSQHAPVTGFLAQTVWSAQKAVGIFCGQQQIPSAHSFRSVLATCESENMHPVPPS